MRRPGLEEEKSLEFSLAKYYSKRSLRPKNDLEAAAAHMSAAALNRSGDRECPEQTDF
jgi:hypothetical protein